MELSNYERSLKYRQDAMNGIDYAYKQGVIKGYREGFTKEYKKGLEQGIEHGRKESTLEVAKNMKAINEPIEKIMAITGLSKEVIDQL